MPTDPKTPAEFSKQMLSQLDKLESALALSPGKSDAVGRRAALDKYASQLDNYYGSLYDSRVADAYPYEYLSNLRTFVDNYKKEVQKLADDANLDGMHPKMVAMYLLLAKHHASEGLELSLPLQTPAKPKGEKGQKALEQLLMKYPELKQYVSSASSPRKSDLGAVPKKAWPQAEQKRRPPTLTA